MNCIKWTLIKLASIHITMVGVFFSLHNFGSLIALKRARRIIPHGKLSFHQNLQSNLFQ